jgi:hypothetical protein
MYYRGVPMPDKTKGVDSSRELAMLLQSASKAPGVLDVMALYSHYQKIESVAEPVRKAMQARSSSSVSNGSYPALTR